MRHTILTIRDGQCRFPMTDDLPHFFCGEVTALGRVYCDEHHVVCNKGFGCSVVELEHMIRNFEHTVVRRHQGGESPTTQAVDVVVRE